MEKDVKVVGLELKLSFEHEIKAPRDVRRDGNANAVEGFQKSRNLGVLL